MNSLVKSLLTIIRECIFLYCTEGSGAMNDLAILINFRRDEDTKLCTSCS